MRPETPTCKYEVGGSGCIKNNKSSNATHPREETTRTAFKGALVLRTIHKAQRQNTQQKTRQRQQKERKKETQTKHKSRTLHTQQRKHQTLRPPELASLSHRSCAWKAEPRVHLSRTAVLFAKPFQIKALSPSTCRRSNTADDGPARSSKNWLFGACEQSRRNAQAKRAASFERERDFRTASRDQRRQRKRRMGMRGKQATRTHPPTQRTHQPSPRPSRPPPPTPCFSSFSPSRPRRQCPLLPLSLRRLSLKAFVSLPTLTAAPPLLLLPALGPLVQWAYERDLVVKPVRTHPPFQRN